ncbi:MAG: exodeoxyribonuclease III [Sphingomonadales bacterium]
MKIATFNVNSIKARLPRVLEWIRAENPDVACLQEIKSLDENFPRMEFEALGYNIETHGQKTYNGVAILSKYPIEEVKRGLEGLDFPDNNDLPCQARYIEATIQDFRIASIYLPNGNPLPGYKYDYKLRWMDRLILRALKLLKSEQKVVLSGDFNIIPKDEDCYDPQSYSNDAACLPESRAKYRTLLNMGYYDAFRQMTPEGNNYTFWDYQRGSWQKDNGLRIDMHLLSPQALDCLKDCQVNRLPRSKEKASDHTPLWVELVT